MGERASTYPVKITYSSPGAVPPVYVAGSFTQPEWQPLELEYALDENKAEEAVDATAYSFYRTFHLPEGSFQYKFRLGHEGDWWVCDGKAPIVDDGRGIPNNQLVVNAQNSEFLSSTSEYSVVDKSPDSSITSPSLDLSEKNEPAASDPREESKANGSGNFKPDMLHPDDSLKKVGSLPRQSKEDQETIPPILTDDSGGSARVRKANAPSSLSASSTGSKSPPQPSKNIWRRFIAWLSSLLVALFGKRND